MPTRLRSQRTASKATSGWFTPDQLAGAYAFKFSGYAVQNSDPWFLTGLGRFQIDAAGRLTGKHRSAITALKGQAAHLRASEYRLDGSISIDGDGTGTASILFSAITPGRLNLLGDFFVVLPGSAERIWMISSKCTIPETRELADELVNLEAVRVPS